MGKDFPTSLSYKHTDLIAPGFSRNDAGYRVGGARRNVVQGISQVGQHAEVVIIGWLD